MLSCVRSPTGKITAAATALLLLLLPVCRSTALALCLIHGTAMLRRLKDLTGGYFYRIAAQ